MNARGHAVGREDDGLALRDVGLLLHEHGAAGAQLLHDVLVVHDLLADVHGRPVQLECPLDGLHCAIHAGAVAARSGEQELFRSRERHSGSEASEEPQHGLPRDVETALGHGREVVAAPVVAVEVEVDEVDRGHPLLEKRAVVVEQDRPRSHGGKALAAPTRRAAARSRLQSSGSRRSLARDRAGGGRPRSRAAPSRAHPGSGGPPPCSPAAPRARTACRARRAGSPRRRRGRTRSCAEACAGGSCGPAARPPRCRTPRRWRPRSRGHPSCRSAPRARRTPASAAGHLPHHVAQSPGHRLVAPAREEPPQPRASRREVREPAGRGPISTCSRSSRWAASESKRSTRGRSRAGDADGSASLPHPPHRHREHHEEQQRQPGSSRSASCGNCGDPPGPRVGSAAWTSRLTGTD